MRALTRATAPTMGHAAPLIDLELTERQPWVQNAACKDLDAKLIDTFFFPINEDLAPLSEPARQICQSCPVQYECLEFAMNTRLPLNDDPPLGRPPRAPYGLRLRGIWGGTTTGERAYMRRAWR